MCNVLDRNIVRNEFFSDVRGWCQKLFYCTFPFFSSAGKAIKWHIFSQSESVTLWKTRWKIELHAAFLTVNVFTIIQRDDNLPTWTSLSKRRIRPSRESGFYPGWIHLIGDTTVNASQRNGNCKINRTKNGKPSEMRKTNLKGSEVLMCCNGYGRARRNFWSLFNISK